MAKKQSTSTPSTKSTPSNQPASSKPETTPKQGEITIEIIEIGEAIDIELSIPVPGTKEIKQLTFQSTAEEKLGSNLLVKPIKHNNKAIGISDGIIANMYYIKSGKVYRWNHVKVTLVKYNNEVYHSIELNTPAEVLNRRGAFRVFIGERMNVTSFTSHGPQTKQVLIKDISESGFSFLSEDEFVLKRTVRLTLPFSEHYNLDLTAQIVRAEKPTEEEDNQVGKETTGKPRKRITETTYGCKFVEQNPKLPTYLMKKQQEKRGRKV